MLGQRLLRFGWVDVHAPRHHHVAEPVGDEDVAVGIDVADLAQREEPGLRVRGRCLLRVVRVLDAPTRRIPEEQPALRPRGELLAAGVEDDGRQRWHGPADGARVVEPLLARDGARRPDLGGAVGLGEHRAPPLDHRPLDRNGAGGAGVGDELEGRDVVAGSHLVGQGEEPHEVGRDHDRGLDTVLLDRSERGLRVEAPEDHRGHARGEEAHPVSGPVWYIGPTTRWVP